jgi:hypothetical protein
MRNHRVYCTAVRAARARLAAAVLGCPAGEARQHSTRPNKKALFLSFPQEVSPLHSFYTTKPHFAIALILPLPQSASSQKREMFCICSDKGSALPVIFESESPGEIRRMSSVPVPGLYGLQRNPPSKEDGNAEPQT